ncbi:hypothetical protein [Geodermatophilus sp. SYSU D00696]
MTTPSGVTRVTDPPRVVDVPPVRAGAPPGATAGADPPPDTAWLF